MVKGEEGVWIVTAPPLVPVFQTYSLVIDGVAVAGGGPLAGQVVTRPEIPAAFAERIKPNRRSTLL